jgi:hypothetical protein
MEQLHSESFIPALFARSPANSPEPSRAPSPAVDLGIPYTASARVGANVADDADETQLSREGYAHLLEGGHVSQVDPKGQTDPNGTPSGQTVTAQGESSADMLIPGAAEAETVVARPAPIPLLGGMGTQLYMGGDVERLASFGSHRGQAAEEDDEFASRIGSANGEHHVSLSVCLDLCIDRLTHHAVSCIDVST